MSRKIKIYFIFASFFFAVAIVEELNRPQFHDSVESLQVETHMQLKIGDIVDTDQLAGNYHNSLSRIYQHKNNFRVPATDQLLPTKSLLPNNPQLHPLNAQSNYCLSESSRCRRP